MKTLIISLVGIGTLCYLALDLHQWQAVLMQFVGMGFILAWQRASYNG